MKILLKHGSGGLETRELIKNIFLKHFYNKFTSCDDAASLPAVGTRGMAFTTDSYVVKPLFFPGGDIGRLAVCGTVNDLLTTGGVPMYISASFIIEENTDAKILDEIARSMRRAADEAGVSIVTGDTKVTEGGGEGGVYVTTSGIGTDGGLSPRLIKEGDCIITSGSLGNHHACIVSQRMGITNSIESDAAPLTGIVRGLTNAGVTLRAMRDMTRGGAAASLNELSEACGLKAVLNESEIPVDVNVAGLCKILGLDPLQMGNEGKMLIIVPEREADRALGLIKKSPCGEYAAVVGRFYFGGGVELVTRSGGRRVVPMPSGEGLPRIC
ncbi:MAG: hydrogenase expression/formation protein HypE [Defluviitaleaceae bacterium]|nr:hydrogenase expression/formation protein HypE [Defluviitaleaceae bacterium]